MTAIGPGTRVKCIFNGPWVDCFGDKAFGPTFRSEWTVKNVVDFGDIGIQIELCEWIVKGQSFSLKSFRPIDGESELAILRSIALNPRGYVELPSREPAETAV